MYVSLQYNYHSTVQSYNTLAFMLTISLQCNLFEFHYLPIHLANNFGTQLFFVMGLFISSTIRSVNHMAPLFSTLNLNVAFGSDQVPFALGFAFPFIK